MVHPGSHGRGAKASGAPRAACPPCTRSPAGTPGGDACRSPCRRPRRRRRCRPRAVRSARSVWSSMSRLLAASDISCSRSKVLVPASAWSSPAPSPESRSRSARSSSATEMSCRSRSTSARSSVRTPASSLAVHGDSSSRTTQALLRRRSGLLDRGGSLRRCLDGLRRGFLDGSFLGRSRLDRCRCLGGSFRRNCLGRSRSWPERPPWREPSPAPPWPGPS